MILRACLNTVFRILSQGHSALPRILLFESNKISNLVYLHFAKKLQSNTFTEWIPKISMELDQKTNSTTITTRMWARNAWLWHHRVTRRRKFPTWPPLATVKAYYCYDNVLRAILLRKISGFPSGTRTHGNVFMRLCIVSSNELRKVNKKFS